MNLPLPWPFDRDYMQLALVAGLLVGGTAPLVGTFVVQRRLSLLGDGLGHLAFAGVAAALLVGAAPVPVALGVAGAGALAIERLRASGRVTGDLALALFFYGGLAAGAVLAGRAAATGRSVNVVPYLFGSILTVTPTDVLLVAGLAAVIAATVALAGRALLAVALDEDAARVSGLPVDALNGAVAVLAAGVVVAAMQVVGLLLVAALMVLPVAAARRVARSFRSTVWISAAVGVGSVVVGLVAARAGDLAPGGMIVLCSAASFALSGLAGRRAGPRRA
jgi:zinc transport system permease protein